MDAALITAICGGIVAIVGAFWGIIKYYDSKKERRMKEEREASEQRLRDERTEHERIRQEEKTEYELRLEQEKQERQHYEQTIEKDRQESNTRRADLYGLVEKTLINIEHSNVEQQKSINQLAKNVQEIKEQIGILDTTVNEQKQEIFENELNRLQSAIITFANGLRAGNKLNSDNYKYICHTYDKYRKMGGNSFIVAEMDYIRSEYQKGDSEK